MIYGLLSENDGRVLLEDSSLDNKVMLFRVHNVINPIAAYKKSSLNFQIEHARYTYMGGPKLTVHETVNGVNFETDVAPGTSTKHKCETANNYDMNEWPDDIVLFVKCSAVLNRPVLEGGTIRVELKDATSTHGM